MPRTAARFTQADIARALKAIEQAGARMAVEVGVDGVIRIVPADDKTKSYGVDNPEIDGGKGIRL